MDTPTATQAITAAELREGILETVNAIDDVQLLMTISSRVYSYADQTTWDDLPPERRASIERGYQQALRGEFVSAEELRARLPLLKG